MNQIVAINQFEESSLELEGHLHKIFKDFKGRPEDLIPMLQMVQGSLGYLPEKALLEIAYITGLPSSKVFGVATFYAQFRLQPAGRHIIRVCRGTACHVRGSGRILKHLQARLRVLPGGTTADRLFTLDTVACFGSCALAPVVVIDDRVYGRMNPLKVQDIIDEIAVSEKDSQTEGSYKRLLGGQDGLRMHEG